MVAPLSLYCAYSSVVNPKRLAIATSDADSVTFFGAVVLPTDATGDDFLGRSKFFGKISRRRESTLW